MPEKVVKVGTSQLQVTSTPVCSAGEGGGERKINWFAATEFSLQLSQYRE